MTKFPRLSGLRRRLSFAKPVATQMGEPKPVPKELVESIEKYCALLLLCTAIAAYAVMRAVNYDHAIDAVVYAEKALAAIHAIEDFGTVPHREATIHDSRFFEQSLNSVLTPRLYCYSGLATSQPESVKSEMIKSCKAWLSYVQEQQKDMPAGRVFLVQVESQLGRSCIAGIIKGSNDVSTRQMTPNDPIIGYTDVPGSLTYLVVVSCGGDSHKEAFIVADGRASKPPTFVLDVEAAKSPSILGTDSLRFPGDSDPSCIGMTDMYKAGLPSVFTEVLGWTHICYVGDAASMLNEFVSRYLARALQTAIPSGDADATMHFAHENFVGDSNRAVQLDFSSLKVNFRDAVLINCVVACFVCFVVYIRSSRMREYNTQSPAPSVLLDHDSAVAKGVSCLALLFLCIAPLVCMASVVIFNKVGIVVVGPTAFVEFVDEWICQPLGTSCGPRDIQSISWTMTSAASAGVLSEIVMLLAVINFGRYTVRATRFTQSRSRISTGRPRFFDRVHGRDDRKK